MNSIIITGINMDVTENTKKYVDKKIGRLDRLMPRHARKSATAEVKLKQVNRDHGNKHEVEVILHVPDAHLSARDSTTNVLAAVDIVEAKLVSQLHKYKLRSIAHLGNRRMMARFKRSFQRESQSV